MAVQTTSPELALTVTEQSTPIEKNWEHSSYEEIFAYWRQIIRTSDEETFFLFDIDDTLVESMMLWVEGMMDLHNSHVTAQVTIQQLLDMIDPFAYIRSQVGDELYEEAESRFRVDERMNTHGALVHENLPHFVERLLERHGALLGGLTARQDSDVTRMQTWKKLRQAELLDGYPVMFRPLHIKHDTATRIWKPDVLVKLQGLQEGKNLILVDDNVYTAKGVGECNEKTPHRPIMQILLRTQVNVAAVNQLIEEGLPPGVFVASSWEEVEVKVEEAKVWAQQRRDSVAR